MASTLAPSSSQGFMVRSAALSPATCAWARDDRASHRRAQARPPTPHAESAVTTSPASAYRYVEDTRSATTSSLAICRDSVTTRRQRRAAVHTSMVSPVGPTMTARDASHKAHPPRASKRAHHPSPRCAHTGKGEGPADARARYCAPRRLVFQNGTQDLRAHGPVVRRHARCRAQQTHAPAARLRPAPRLSAAPSATSGPGSRSHCCPGRCSRIRARTPSPRRRSVEL